MSENKNKDILKRVKAIKLDENDGVVSNENEDNIDFIRGQAHMKEKIINLLTKK